MKSKLINFLSLLFGFFLVSLYIWFRFIRVRIPKEIPFELNIYIFISFIIICLIYIYIILYLIFRHEIIIFMLKLKPNNLTNILYNISMLVITPIITLDNTIKHNGFVYTHYPKFLRVFITIIQKFNYKFLYFISNIFPRIIILSALILDIFYFQYFFYIYKILYFAIPILLSKYIIYSFKAFREASTKHLDRLFRCIVTNYIKSEDDPDFPEDFDEIDAIQSRLSAQRFVEVQSNAICYDNLFYEGYFELSYTGRRFLRKKFNLKPYDKKRTYTIEEMRIDNNIMETPYYSLMNELVIPVSVLLEEYDIYENYYNYFKYIKIIIYSLFLCCWIYLLFTASIYSLCLKYILL